MQDLATLLYRFGRLPFVQGSIPGAVLEAALAHVRQARVLPTYEFVDVLRAEQSVGWQVKSTLSGTPVTWNRAKLPERVKLIAASRSSVERLQHLGDTIIAFCNEHALASMKIYNLRQIGYARLIVFPDGKAHYFEKTLCSRQRPLLFEPAEFEWRWSAHKQTQGKEQLSALHGWHRPTDSKWFAWHGAGENQLHFTGDKY